MASDPAEGTIRYLRYKVDAADKSQDFVCVSWKKDVFVRF